MLDDKTLLITGGTGSFGQQLTRTVLTRYRPHRLVILSRDELKQYEMAQRLSPAEHRCLRYFIGDVRDRERLYRAFDGVDVVIHAAALKQVPACEYNPIEAVKTNILGAANVIDAAIDRGVRKVIALSTDKAANPVNLYGATKLCSDKLLTAGNHYAGPHQTRFSVVRYGNVLGSRGSVVPFFLERRGQGRLPITDPRMTRFWISLQQAVDFVLAKLDEMLGGEVFVPKLPSMRITDLVRAIAPECELDIVGIRPGEKLHEVMVPEDDAHHTLEQAGQFVILPSFYREELARYRDERGGTPCPQGFRYSSDRNDVWLSVADLRELVLGADAAHGESRGPDAGPGPGVLAARA
jgi:UDP-N-acetylglucosamine 4,6-dehydratase